MSSLHHHAADARRRTEEVDIITTAHGGEDVATAAAQAGALIGFESHKQRPPESFPIDFVDWPYFDEEDEQAVSFVRHLLVVEQEKPKYAVAPDVNGERSFERTLTMADELAKHAETVIVVPKAVKPERVPDRFRVGIPFRDDFEGLPWPVWEYRGVGPVHILGGHPDRQLELVTRLDADIGSIDTAHPTMKANWGNVWTRNGYTQKEYGYYRTVKKSFNNLLLAWSSGISSRAKLRRKVAREMFDLPGSSFDEGAELVDQHENTMDCWGADEQVPFPGREAMVEAETPMWEPGLTFGELQGKT